MSNRTAVVLAVVLGPDHKRLSQEEIKEHVEGLASSALGLKWHQVGVLLYPLGQPSTGKERGSPALEAGTPLPMGMSRTPCTISQIAGYSSADIDQLTPEADDDGGPLPDLLAVGSVNTGERVGAIHVPSCTNQGQDQQLSHCSYDCCPAAYTSCAVKNDCFHVS